MNKIERMAALLNRLADLGFSYSEAQSLRRIEMTLQRWGEAECGDSNNSCSWAIERDEKTGRPYRVIYPHAGDSYRVAVADREAGALRRLKAIMDKHAGLWAYHQSDPRGCQLYIGRKSDLGDLPIDQVYNRGVAVCV